MDRHNSEFTAFVKSQYCYFKSVPTFGFEKWQQ